MSLYSEHPPVAGTGTHFQISDSIERNDRVDRSVLIRRVLNFVLPKRPSGEQSRGSGDPGSGLGQGQLGSGEVSGEAAVIPRAALQRWDDTTEQF